MLRTSRTLNFISFSWRFKFCGFLDIKVWDLPAEHRRKNKILQNRTDDNHFEGMQLPFFSRELFFCYFVCTLNILRYLENYSFTGHDNCVFFVFMIILFNYYYFLALSFKKFVPDIIHFLLAFARLCYNNLICISSLHVDNNSQRLLLLFCPFCG